MQSTTNRLEEIIGAKVEKHSLGETGVTWDLATMVSGPGTVPAHYLAITIPSAILGQAHAATLLIQDGPVHTEEQLDEEIRVMIEKLLESRTESISGGNVRESGLIV